jgi:hypothetical protein
LISGSDRSDIIVSGRYGKGINPHELRIQLDFIDLTMVVVLSGYCGIVDTK